MKIIFLAHMWRATDVTDDERIADELRSLGHEVVTFDLNQWPLVLEASPSADFVLTTKGIRPELIVQLQTRFDCPVLYWCWDRMVPADGWPPKALHLNSARLADGFSSPELGLAARYREAGARFHYLPLDVSPSEFGKEGRFLTCSKQDKARVDEIAAGGRIPVIFTATWHGRGIRRERVIQELQDRLGPVELHAFGNSDDRWTREGFQHGHRQIWERGFQYLVGKSEVCLALDYLLDLEGCWSNRPARYMVCGGFTLLRYILGMERTFGPDGENLVYWHSVDDGAEKIGYYLAHEDERAEIAARGQRFAQDYLTISYRVRQLLTVVRAEYGLEVAR